MKRALIILLLVTFSLSTLFSETLTHSSLKYEYEEYEDEEFPIWSNELRRAEILYFGSYVFTIPFATFAVSGLRNMNVIGAYESTEKDALLTLGIASGFSLFVAGLDWLIGRISD